MKPPFLTSSSVLLLLFLAVAGCHKSGGQPSGPTNGNGSDTIQSNSNAPVVDTAQTLYICGGTSLYAFNAGTGVLRWQKALGGAGNSSPIYYHGNIYTGCEDGKLYAFDTTGKMIWSLYTGDTIETSSPMVYNGSIYIDNWSSVLAVDATTGAVKWKFNIPMRNAYNSGVVVANNTVYFHAPNLFALDASSGNLKWTSNYGMGANLPKVYNNKLYDFGYLTNYKIAALDATTGDVIWGQYVEGVDGIAINVVNGYAYFYNDFALMVVDTATGHGIFTKAYLPAYGNWFEFQAGSSPVVADSVINLVEDGNVNGVEQYWASTGAYFGQYSTNMIGADVTAINARTYYGTRDQFYVTNLHGQVYALQVQWGTVWTSTVTDDFRTTPCVVTSTGKVYRAGDVY